MKKIVNIGRKPIIFDTETEEIKAIRCDVRGIDDVFVVPEDAKLCWNNSFNDTVEDVDVNKGDIIITFYTTDLGTDHVVLKSEDWLKGIEFAREKAQKDKEEWALRKSMCHNTCPDPVCGDSQCTEN